LSAIYAAAKIEEHSCPIQQILDVAFHPESPLAKEGIFQRLEADVILGYELTFLKQLDFQLVCFHPFRCISAILDLRRDAGDDEKEIERMAVAANRMVTGRILFSDVVLSSTPGQIALVSVVSALRKGSAVAFDVDTLLAAIQPISNAQQRADIMADVDRIILALSDTKYEKKLTLEDLRALEGRRKAVSNRGSDPDSDEYKERVRREEEEKDEHRRNKAKKAEERKRKEQEELLGPLPVRQKI